VAAALAAGLTLPAGLGLPAPALSFSFSVGWSTFSIYFTTRQDVVPAALSLK
jgi:hypothetical protein